MKRIRSRSLASIVAAAALALVVCGCAGGQSHPRSGTASRRGASPNARLVAFARCMRSHGVPKYPDPPAGATNAKFGGAQQLGVSSHRLQGAERACGHLLPPGVDDEFPHSEVRVLLGGMLRFSRCMRSHGLRSWPDPTIGRMGRPEFPVSSAPGLNENSPRILQIGHVCGRLLPAALGGIPVG